MLKISKHLDILTIKLKIMKTIMSGLLILSFVLYFLCVVVLHFKLGNDTVNLVCDIYLVVMVVVYGYYGTKIWWETLDK